MQAWTGIQFLAEAFPEPPWLVRGLIPGSGWTALIAEPKIGKTTFCLQLLLALIIGRPFLHWPELAPMGRVAIVEADAPRVELQTQLRALVPHHAGIDLSRLVVVHEPAGYIMDPKETFLVWTHLRDVNPGFVVFDALESSIGQGVNATADAARTIMRFTALAGENVPFLVIHHPRKRSQDPAATGDDVRDVGAGSHYLASNASALLQLHPTQIDVVTRQTRDTAYPLARVDLEGAGLWDLPKLQPPTGIDRTGTLQPPDGTRGGSDLLA